MLARWLTRVALLVLGAGLGVGVGFWWSYQGTSWLAERQATAAVKEFRDAVPLLASGLTSELHTDLDATPPPTVEASASGAWGLLAVPRWQGETGVYDELIDGVLPISEGTGRSVLSTGAAGHYVETAMPRQVGNFALAGHRRTHGNNFLPVARPPARRTGRRAAPPPGRRHRAVHGTARLDQPWCRRLRTPQLCRGNGGSSYSGYASSTVDSLSDQLVVGLDTDEQA